MDLDIESQSTPVLFAKLYSEITDGIYDLTANVKAIRRLLVKVKTSTNGSDELERRLSSLTEETLGKFRVVGHLTKTLDSLDSKALEATQRFSQEKLSNEFKSMLYEFKILQKEAASQERTKVNAAKAQNAAAVAESAAEPTENTPLKQHQQIEQQQSLLDVVDQEEVVFNNSLIADREEEIQQIERGINEINSIFRDLGTLVNEQGSNIDMIEENISTLATNTQQASTQLNQANDYQKKRRKWSCYILTFLIVILLVVVLVILA